MISKGQVRFGYSVTQRDQKIFSIGCCPATKPRAFRDGNFSWSWL